MSYVNANEVLPDVWCRKSRNIWMDSFCIFQESRAMLFQGRKERHQRQNGRTKQTDTDTFSFRSGDLRTERRVLPFGKADPGNHTCM